MSSLIIDSMLAVVLSLFKLFLLQFKYIKIDQHSYFEENLAKLFVSIEELVDVIIHKDSHKKDLEIIFH